MTDHLDTFSVSKLGIDLLVKIAEKNSGQLFGLVGDPLAKLKASLTVNFSDYFTSAVDKCSRTSTLFDRSKPVPLDSIYITTRLLHSHTILSDVKFRNLLVTIPHGEAIRTFLVLGSAGTGKTFFLRWLFLRLLENPHSRIPFYVELRGLNAQSEPDILSFIHSSIVRQRASITLDSFESGMRSGDFIFLLDGLDEVRHDLRGGIGNRLAHLQESYPGAILVVSSHPDESLHSWTLARQYLVQPFAKREALALINKLPYKSDTKRKFREDVNTDLYEKYTSFLSNPLLLTIMLITYSDLGEVPSKWLLHEGPVALYAVVVWHQLR